MTRANDACRTRERLWIAFAPSGHLRNRPLALRVFACESAENDIDLRAAPVLLEVLVATFCDGLDCLSFATGDLSFEVRREDSSLDVIVTAFGGYWSKLF